jgi:hypothetical protein
VEVDVKLDKTLERHYVLVIFCQQMNAEGLHKFHKCYVSGMISTPALPRSVVLLM